MSTEETTTPAPHTMALQMEVCEYPPGSETQLTAILGRTKAIVIEPHGYDDDGQGGVTLQGRIHLSKIGAAPTALLLRDIADLLESGEAVTADD